MMLTRRTLVLLGLIALMVGVRYSPIADYLSLSSFKAHKEALIELVKNHYVFATMSYICVYTIGMVCMLPVATLLAVAGGFLFGSLPGAAYACIGATVGSSLSFMIVRYLFADTVRKKYAEHVGSFDQSVDRHGTFYLLMVHLVAVIPLSLINLCAAVTRVSLFDFVWTTAGGVFPIALIYAHAGSHLGAINTMADVFSSGVLVSLGMVAAFALSAIALYRFWYLKIAA